MQCWYWTTPKAYTCQVHSMPICIVELVLGRFPFSLLVLRLYFISFGESRWRSLPKHRVIIFIHLRTPSYSWTEHMPCVHWTTPTLFIIMRFLSRKTTYTMSRCTVMYCILRQKQFSLVQLVYVPSPVKTGKVGLPYSFIFRHVSFWWLHMRMIFVRRSSLTQIGMYFGTMWIY